MAIKHNSDQIIKSPLRYPGGKSKAWKYISPMIPEFKEYREPMVGGASIFFALKNLHPDAKYWINDKNYDLYLFWKFCKEKPNELTNEIKKMKDMFHHRGRGRRLYRYLITKGLNLTELQIAARFFILNRITFSGLIESGGFSKESYDRRFTDSSINRIIKASEILQNVEITNLDYSEVIQRKGDDVFIFMDPPYLLSKEKAKLYGKRGDLHKEFDHKGLRTKIEKCGHKCLITYDKCAGIMEMYKFIEENGWKKKEWQLQYGTNSYKNKKEAAIGQELFIYNYELPKKD